MFINKDQRVFILRASWDVKTLRKVVVNIVFIPFVYFLSTIFFIFNFLFIFLN